MRTRLPRCRCILSKFYIKPQHGCGPKQNSNSCILSKFYIKPQHGFDVLKIAWSCILSKFYIKPQRGGQAYGRSFCCILSKFYIKPQQCCGQVNQYQVVSYRNSTSNHNYPLLKFIQRKVVSYRNSTSNHNVMSAQAFMMKLYLIEILHQTTTWRPKTRSVPGCILSKFYIKPQQSR